MKTLCFKIGDIHEKVKEFMEEGFAMQLSVCLRVPKEILEERSYKYPIDNYYPVFITEQPDIASLRLDKCMIDRDKQYSVVNAVKMNQNKSIIIYISDELEEIYGLENVSNDDFTIDYDIGHSDHLIAVNISN